MDGMKFVVTGGAGFIGSCVVRRLVAAGKDVVTFDMLTCAGHVESLGEALSAPNHSLEQADIRDGEAVRQVLLQARPDAVIHLAPESRHRFHPGAGGIRVAAQARSA